MAEQSGDIVAGRYQLERCLARGGMGSVWVAKHLELGMAVAVKLLRPDQRPDDERVERFRREAQQAGSLKSPHVVRIQDFGVDDGVPFIVMELLLGEDLGHRLDRVEKLAPDVALRFLSHAAKGLEVAHRAGIVHRDIKPANLFLERHGTEELLKVVDFGVAKHTGGDSQLTTGGVVWGSPAYMSPEQARGGPVDAKTDVWALSAVFYRMLTGRAPFVGNSEHDVIVKLCTETAPAATELNPELPREMDGFFRHALARDPGQRIGSVTELVLQAADALGLPRERLSSPDLALVSPVTSPKEEGRETATQPLAADGDRKPSLLPEESQPLPVTDNTRPQRVRYRHLAGAAGVTGLLLLGASWLARSRNLPSREPPAVDLSSQERGDVAPPSEEAGSSGRELGPSGVASTWSSPAVAPADTHPTSPAAPGSSAAEASLTGDAARNLTGPARHTNQPSARHPTPGAAPPSRPSPSTRGRDPDTTKDPAPMGAAATKDPATIREPSQTKEPTDPVFGLPLSPTDPASEGQR